MGQASKMAYSSRFIREFNEDFLADRPDLGEKLSVQSVGLGFDGTDDNVRVFYRLINSSGRAFVVMEEQVLWNPIFNEEDVVEILFEQLNIDEEEIVERLRKLKRSHKKGLASSKDTNND